MRPFGVVTLRFTLWCGVHCSDLHPLAVNGKIWQIAALPVASVVESYVRAVSVFVVLRAER